MNNKRLTIIIKLFNRPCIRCYVEHNNFHITDSYFRKVFNIQNTENNETYKLDKINSFYYRLASNGYFLYLFVRELYLSLNYRKNVSRKLYSNLEDKNNIVLYLKLFPPRREIIDYAWNERILKTIWTRVEIENAMFWLSTLGGAFSALGDYFDECAEKAGEISKRQLQLSLMLGDEGLAARSKLYASLAIAQKGNIKGARVIVRSVSLFARKTKDERLNKMCQGVWAKFKSIKLMKSMLRSSKQMIWKTTM